MKQPEFWLRNCCAECKWGSPARNRRKPIDNCQWDKKLAKLKLYRFGGIFHQGNCEMVTEDCVIAPKQPATIIPNWRRKRAVGIHENVFVKPRRKGKAAGSSESEEGWALYWLCIEVPKQHKKASEYLDYLSLCYLNRERQTDRGNSRRPGTCTAKEKDKRFLTRSNWLL